MSEEPRFEDTDEYREAIEVHRRAVLATIADCVQRIKDASGHQAMHEAENEMADVLRDVRYKFFVEDLQRVKLGWQRRQREH